jgi:hypothetical protein
VAEKKFIKRAIKRPGALRARAKREGRSVREQAQHDLHKPGRAGDEARFYWYVLREMRKK